MIKIYFSNSWGEEPDKLLRRYSRQTPNCSGVWKNIIGTTNIREADYCILLEDNFFQQDFDKSKIIYVKREPSFIQNISPSLIPYRNIIHWEEKHCGITWWIDKTYDELKQLKYPEKTKLISCVSSSKHYQRNELIKKIILNNKNIDLYGKGHDKLIYGDSYKGELNYNGNCKVKGMIDYKFSICLENSQERNYWTEKLADAYLSWSLPIYFGCSNIQIYFPKNSYRVIDINNDFNLLNIIREEIDINSLAQARDKILDEYNIWEVVRKKIMEINNVCN